MLLADVPRISPIYLRSEWGALSQDKNFPDLLSFFIFKGLELSNLFLQLTKLPGSYLI